MDKKSFGFHIVLGPNREVRIHKQANDLFLQDSSPREGESLISKIYNTKLVAKGERVFKHDSPTPSFVEHELMGVLRFNDRNFDSQKT